MNKKISIDPITRLEGHGRIDLFLNKEGSLENAYMIIPELRGFEKFCEGRPVEEMPRITQRICGVCPLAHHMAAAKAGDAVYHVEPPPTGKMIRELMYSSFFVADHATHFFVLGGPDFVVGPEAPKSERNILGVVRKVGKEIGSRAIQLLQENHEVNAIIGGRYIYPVAALVGGVSKPLTKDEQKRILAISKRSVETAKFTLKLFNDVVLRTKNMSILFSAICLHTKHTIWEWSTRIIKSISMMARFVLFLQKEKSSSNMDRNNIWMLLLSILKPGPILSSHI